MFTALLTFSSIFLVATILSSKNFQNSSFCVGNIALFQALKIAVLASVNIVIAVEKGSRTFHIYHTPPHNG